MPNRDSVPEVHRFPLKCISLYDCVWPSHDIAPAHLEHPETHREIDNEPIFVEMLITGHWFVHDGRHRCLRALARGEHQIMARCYSKLDVDAA